MSDIDWTVELKNIEREYSGLPPAPTPEQLRVKRAAEQRAQERKNQQAAAFGAWTRMFFVVALASAVNFWPYARSCGPGLFAYMSAAVLIAAGGLWVGVWTWRGRMPKTHGLAMLVVLWGMVLVAAQVLPRVGYAQVDALNPPGWVCK